MITFKQLPFARNGKRGFQNFVTDTRTKIQVTYCAKFVFSCFKPLIFDILL